MSIYSAPDEPTNDNKNPVSDYNMSDLGKSDNNILVEESLSSADNNNAQNETCDVKENSANCSAVLNDLVSSEKNESVDNSVLNNLPDSTENPVANETSIVSNCELDSGNIFLSDSNNKAINNASDSEKNSNENNNEMSNDKSDSGKSLMVDNDNKGSNDPTDLEEKSLTDNNNEVSNHSTNLEKNSLIYNNDEVVNHATDSEKNSTDNNNEVSNHSTNSEKKSLIYNNDEVVNNATDSEKNSTDNNEVVNDVTDSEKNSTDNNEVVNDVTDSGKNSTDNNNEVANDATDSEKNSLIDINNEESNDISDSENSSNLDLNTDNINDTIETRSTEHASDIQENKNEEVKRVITPKSFEAIRLEYEEVLIQCKVNLETLGKDNISLRHQVSDLKMKLSQQEAEFKKKEASIRAELLPNIEKLSRECNVLRKEKEAIVIRYANSEKDVIQAKKVQQDLEKKIKDMTRDRDTVLLKLKNASTENNKLTSSIENKMVEIAKLQKENEKLNADCNSREIRIKWLQNKLKSEVTAHQETQGKLDHTLHRLNEMREEAEQVRRDCQEMIKCYQEAEEIKSVKLDGQLKQKLTELEVQKQEKCDQEQVYMLLRHELDALKKKQRLTMDENNALTLKINSLEKERLEYEQTICKLKDNQNLLKEEIADMTSRLTEMESLKLQLEQEREKSAASLREVERLRLTNAELQSDLDACHVKEGDRLDFVEKLTAKTMLLQSDHCLLEVKAQALEDEVNQLKKALTEVQQNYTEMVAEFDNAKKEHESEMQLLVQKLAEKAKTVEKLNTRLEEAENENRVLKRRHIASIKELSRELYQCKKRLESYESSSGMRAESISLGSRASSSASLHISNSNDVCQSSPSFTYNNKKEVAPGKNGSPESQFTVDKEVLIERIINLQKMLAKKTDKIDFLEDHIEHLVKEMRRKSKSVDFKNV